MKNFYWLTISLFFVVSASWAQKGPGGVSVETGTLTGCGGSAESTCGVWLDASELTTLADGDEINNWPDISISADCDDATVPNNVNPPIFRNDPASTINGLPTITFEDQRYFVLSSSDDLNTTRVTYDKLVLMAFRTSEDVTSKQTIYEEGGTVRGFNIMIHQGDLIIGAYDKQGNDNDDGLSNSNSPNPNNGRTPAWGYTYISRPIQPNTTYILTAKFKAGSPDAPSSAGTVGYGPNVIGNNDFFLQGWLNGVSFGGVNEPSIGGGNFNGFTNAGNIGTLFDHPNPCGLGAVNDDTVDKDQVVNGNNNNLGTWAFKGKLAEMCYYKDEITETERIIVENYLASKYIAILEVQDQYEHEFLYGKDLIGIGRRVNPEFHNLSQGKNAFQIRTPNSISTSSNQYFFIGHNGLNQIWTDAGVPNNSANIERLERVWRVDRTNFTYDIEMSLDEDRLPAPPAGYNSSNAKLVMLVDETSSNIPNFTLPSTIVQEIGTITDPEFERRITYDFPDDAFFTFAWLRPEVNFDITQEFSLESDPAPDFQVDQIALSLNYIPVNNGDMVIDGYTVDFSLIAGTAVLGPGPAGGDDFYYNSSTPGLTSGTVTFNEGVSQAFIPIRIINDDDAEDPSTEDFTISLTGANPTGNSPSISIGPDFEVEYTIYDDDPPPKLNFASFATPIQVNEEVPGGTIDVEIIRQGDASGISSCQVLVIGAGTTARSSALGLDPQDYDNSFLSNTWTFAANETSKLITIPIINDLVDEPTETLQLRLTNINGAAAFSVPGINKVVEFIDNDDPEASFASATQSGPESIGAPSLLVTLDPISSREVVVDFVMNPPLPSTQGTATYSQDYAGALSGTVIFPPFTDEAFIGPFFVYPDGINENDETVVFELTGTTPDGDATLPQPDELIYTIGDYEPFEWKGAAGVGQNTANIIWIDATQEPLGDLGSLGNQSPYNINIVDRPNPATNQANIINGQNSLYFNGSSNTNNADAYEIANNVRINTAGTVDKLSYFFVFRPQSVPNASANNSPTTTEARLIYEQGGGTRGTSIYLFQNRLYFHAWNNANDDGNDDTMTTDTIEGNQAPWGHNRSSTFSNRDIWARSSQIIQPNTNYIVSCHYSNFSSEPLMVYVNGNKGQLSGINASVNPFGVGRLWGHAGRVGFGAVINATLFHFARNSVPDRRCAFQGWISEFISFHEPEMNEARRIVIENYLSGKYNIPLDDNDTPQIWDLGDPEEDTFSNQIAALGQIAGGDASHTDSEGPSAILRVNQPDFSGTNEGFLAWGHNGVELVNTWPTSRPGNELPAGINERSGQVWKFYETGTVDRVDISVDFDASNNSVDLSQPEAVGFLKLLTHTNADFNDFSNATVYDMSGTAQGARASFTDVVISDGMYVALGNTQDYFNTPLPIELLDFDARLNGPVVDLSWVTATETNNEKFIVERSGSDLVWKEIMEVAAAGNSTNTLFYDEKDRNPLKGVSYYRLKQVDYDGTSTTSDIVSIFNPGRNLDDELSLYPNPSSGSSIFIRVPDAAAKERGMITLYDISGKIAFQKDFEEFGSLEELQYGSLPQGVYLVQLESNSVNQTKKLIVQ